MNTWLPSIFECRRTRAMLPAYVKALRHVESGELRVEDLAVRNHLGGCAACARHQQMLSLEYEVIEAAASAERIRPEEEFFRVLRARLVTAKADPDPDQAWSNLLWMGARQLIPVMTMLVLLILGLTWFWRTSAVAPPEQALRPSDRVLFSDVYDSQPPTSDDVLETLVAVEDKRDGK